ncbi:MAG: hypothetical protein K5694_04735 [Bacilli bacterium]|nr:hypothetical protein [Bacilli bacterium]
MKNLNLLALNALCLVALSSCGISSGTSSSSTSELSADSSSTSIESQIESSSEESSSSIVNKGYTVYESSGDRLGINRSANVFFGEPCLDTIGTKKLLIIPFATKDANAFTNSELSIIEKAYNGSPSDTGWESLASYYEASSYGKLHLEATVASPFTSTMTTDQMANKYDGGTWSLEDYLSEVVESYADEIDLTQFDLDKDGFIDGVQFVYKNNGDSSADGDSDLWWNSTYSSYGEGNVSSPAMGVYFWSMLSLIKTGFYTPNIDTHTLVHESGHMMGLDDYYSYKDTTDGGPAGCVDMMDWNVGDHNASSKLLLGWVNPFVPDGSEDEFVITLNDFESSGDCLMLVNPDSWNGTMYDEYFMAEYYTPTGLNEKDALEGYEEWAGYGNDDGHIYNTSGIKLFHVDNRLGGLNWSKRKEDYVLKDFVDSFDESGYDVISIVGSNSSEYTYSGYNRLEIIPASGTNYFKENKNYSSHYGENKVLFGLNSECGGDTFNASIARSVLENGTKMNDGSSIPYSFTVTSQEETSITLKVVKLS